ncbi:MAG: hypothetical protein CL609_21940 [Anaerolineaceae bacterium]|nr:hypothetical protein [Anaerolineaceae bacterium]
MFVLFISHHLLNWHWYKTMFKGRYTLYRIVQRTIDVLVFAAMVSLMISGIMLSQHVFVIFSICGGTSFARILHMLATYWGFVLMAFHFGLQDHSAILQSRRLKSGPNSDGYRQVGARCRPGRGSVRPLFRWSRTGG